jgi:hypothetical protein
VRPAPGLITSSFSVTQQLAVTDPYPTAAVLRALHDEGRTERCSRLIPDTGIGSTLAQRFTVPL